MNFVFSLQNVSINQDASGTTGTTTVITRSNEARFFDLQKTRYLLGFFLLLFLPFWFFAAYGSFLGF